MSKSVTDKEQAVLARLDSLVMNTRTFRATMDRIFVRKFCHAKDCRRYFSDLLICLSVLYLDYLLITKYINELWNLARDRDGAAFNTSRHHREARLRDRFLDRLTKLPCLGSFKPESIFSPLTGLSTMEDYINAFALHLPEIYEETLELEERVNIFKKSFDSHALGGIEVGLQHMGRNHISFVHLALEGAADEASWLGYR